MLISKTLRHPCNECKPLVKVAETGGVQQMISRVVLYSFDHFEHAYFLYSRSVEISFGEAEFGNNSYCQNLVLPGTCVDHLFDCGTLKAAPTLTTNDIGDSILLWTMLGMF